MVGQWETLSSLLWELKSFGLFHLTLKARSALSKHALKAWTVQRQGRTNPGQWVLCHLHFQWAR